MSTINKLRVMIEDRDFIMCMCRPKGRTARGEPGAAAPVARSRKDTVSGFLSTLSVNCIMVSFY